MKTFLAMLRTCIKQWFPQRNLIIVSEHKVRHVPISGRAQCIMLMLLAGGVCWAAYSTGSYMAARMALKAQNQTLRSIASARVDANFNTLYPSGALLAPAESVAMADAAAMQSLTSPMFTLSAVDNDKLFARVAFLEQRVAQLQATNSTIIQHVKDKTNGRIGDLERIIKQVGLNPVALKKELSEQKPEPARSSAKAAKSQGGPYIPADSLAATSPEEMLLYSRLDELALLQQAVDMLPLSYPIKSAEEQSKFGHRIDPFTGRLAFHAGLDLSGPAGSRVYSAAAGKITTAKRVSSYGNMVDVEHGFGVATRYGHLSKILVTEGQMVKKGDVIGVQGSTGRSTGPHLHYEVRYNDRPINPKNFLKAALHVSQE